MYADGYRPFTIVECERAETVFERHRFFTNQFSDGDCQYHQ